MANYEGGDDREENLNQLAEKCWNRQGKERFG